MDLKKALKTELTEETNTTKKFIERIPETQYDWAPHEKSMKMKYLATHIAELPAWVEMAVHTDGLDFAANEYQPTSIANNNDLLTLLETSLQKGLAALDELKEEDLEKEWLLRHGDTILWKGTKYSMVRLALAQTSHHRAQLGVYLRLLNIPIPGSYGPSADEQTF